MPFANDAQFEDDFRRVGPDATAALEPTGSDSNPTEWAGSENLRVAAADADLEDEDDELDEDDEEDEDDLDEDDEEDDLEDDEDDVEDDDEEDEDDGVIDDEDDEDDDEDEEEEDV